MKKLIHIILTQKQKLAKWLRKEDKLEYFFMGSLILLLSSKVIGIDETYTLLKINLYIAVGIELFDFINFHSKFSKKTISSYMKLLGGSLCHIALTVLPIILI